jgi:predicted small integral membrane protein
MTLRTVKMLLVFGVAILHTLVVFNNVTDYGSNYQFVRHVMMMDTTYPGNHGMWRAIYSPTIHTAFYVSIITWETLVALLCWWGGFRLARAQGAPAAAFQRAEGVSLAGLTVSLLLWLVAFQGVGGEWFLMWQSKSWNGMADAFRMFAVVGIVLLVVLQPGASEASKP